MLNGALNHDIFTAIVESKSIYNICIDFNHEDVAVTFLRTLNAAIEVKLKKNKISQGSLLETLVTNQDILQQFNNTELEPNLISTELKDHFIHQPNCKLHSQYKAVLWFPIPAISFDFICPLNPNLYLSFTLLSVKVVVT